jgi:hypothetical protein
VRELRMVVEVSWKESVLLSGKIAVAGGHFERMEELWLGDIDLLL